MSITETASAEGTASDDAGLDPRSRSAWSARGWAIYLGWIVITLDVSSLNLALPTIGNEMRAPLDGISWVVDAYTLPLASLLLLGGSLGDRIGAEKLFRVGSLGFAASSVACALSPSFGMLIASRAAQGIFAAMLLPMLLALVGTSFGDSWHRAKAVNLMTVFGGVGMAAGPFLGGLLTDAIGWRAVFWLTTPIAIAAAFLVGRSDGPGPVGRRLRFDVAGQVTGTLGLVALVAGLIEAGRDTAPSLTWTLLLLGIVFLGTFVFVERRSRAPMMPLSVFRAPGFAGAVIGGFAFQFSAYGLQFFLAVYLQSVWGVSALIGGLLLASFAIGIVLSSTIVNPYLMRRGTRQMMIVGSVTAVIGTMALLGAAGAQHWWLLVLGEFVVGAGSGIYSTALNRTASGSLGAHSAGLASGIYNTSRQIGQSMGIAILGAFAALNNSQVGFFAAIIVVALSTAVIAVTQLRVNTIRLSQ